MFGRSQEIKELKERIVSLENSVTRAHDRIGELSLMSNKNEASIQDLLESVEPLEALNEGLAKAVEFVRKEYCKENSVSCYREDSDTE